MKTCLFGLLGLALLGGGLLTAQAAAAGNDPAACGVAGCGVAGCEAAGCCTVGCDTCGHCCPHCGCRLVPVCHIYCEPKKVTTYQYCLKCEEKCIPRPTCGCNKGCGCGCDSGQCGGECNNGCQEGCGCCVKEVRKLVKCPCVKEVPIRKCTVEWVCPTCGCGCNGEAAPASGQPTIAPPATAPAPAAPLPAAPLPPTPKTTALPRVSPSGFVQTP